jgi:hypothetical protein
MMQMLLQSKVVCMASSAEERKLHIQHAQLEELSLG